MTANVTRIEWYPPESGEMVTFSADWPYRLKDVHGVEPTGSSVQTIKSPSQVGETPLDVSVSARTIAVSIMIGAESNDDLWAKRRALSRSMVSRPARFGEDVRPGLLRFFRGDMTVLEIEAFPKVSPQGSKLIGAPFFMADLEWDCPDPDFRETEDSARVMQGEDGGLEFTDLEFDPDIEFPENNLEVEVVNESDMDVPVVMRLYGDVTDARLRNMTTGESIEVEGQIEDGFYVEIHTAFGQKDIELVEIATGERTPYLANLNLNDADFWNLRPGSNFVRFEASVNTSGHARLYWRERYGGI